MVGIYSVVAENKIALAEKLVADGISLRAQVLEALDRADQIARSLARFLSSDTVVTDGEAPGPRGPRG